MADAPRIWLEYRPIRIGWLVTDRDLAQVETAASWNTCLWGGGFNPIIPLHDDQLAEHLVTAFQVDVLVPIQKTDATQAFADRFPYLTHNRWHDSIFHERNCEFTDIRHVARRIVKHQDRRVESSLILPSWDATDPLGRLLTVMLGAYPQPNEQITDYRGGLRGTFRVEDVAIANGAEVPKSILEGAPPLALTGYDMTQARDHSGWLGPAVILGSITDFDDMVLFWNLRAAGASAVFYDQAHAHRLKALVEGYLDKLRNPLSGATPRITFWTRQNHPANFDWKPDLDLTNFETSINNGHGHELWNGYNIKPNRPHFLAWHRDVVPSYHESDGAPTASFSLPDRPFEDDDVQSLNQKFVVVVDAGQYGPESDYTFETPFIPQMNEFYGRHLYHHYDAVRSERGSLGKGAVGIITTISDQRLSINGYRPLDWLSHFFALNKISIQLSEPGLRCKRLINQFGGLQSCRVLKIRGVRNLLRKYGVDDSFTRSGAIDAIRDVDTATSVASFDLFKDLHIEARTGQDMKPDDVLRYLLKHRVFRVGLELKCPNCELPSWIHLDDVRSNSACPYCDHVYDVTTQLKDRDWRYKRSGIFGRNDNQLGGVPVSLTLQQLSTTLHNRVLMYSTAIDFRSAGAHIETCESDFVVVVSGSAADRSPIQLLLGEAKSGKPIDEQDIRKLGKLADAIPQHLAEVFILFAKTSTFSDEEIRLAKSLNSGSKRRVILWSQDELEPYFVYERAADRLGAHQYAVSLSDMAKVTQQLYFGEPAKG